MIFWRLLVRLALWPLNQSAMRSSLKMQELQPRLQSCQKKYKDKPEKQREEMMKVYQEAGVSPFTGTVRLSADADSDAGSLRALLRLSEYDRIPRRVRSCGCTDISVKDPFYILPLLMGHLDVRAVVDRTA